MVEQLEDIEWFHGLHGEVVTSDCYKLRDITWQPDVIFDIGGNVGCFTRFARELFPNAKIIAVEPHPYNYEVFKKFTNDDNLVLLNKAIGKGKLWHHGTNNKAGGNQVYTSAGIGYPEDTMNDVTVSTEEENNLGNMVVSTIDTVLPAELIDTYVKEGDKVLMKIDCEGGENAIWADQESIDKMKTVDHIVMELHWFAMYGGTIYDEMKEKTLKALAQFEDTHNCEITNISFTAIKK